MSLDNRTHGGGVLLDCTGCEFCDEHLFEAWERMTTGGVTVSTEDADMVFPEFIEPYVVCSERWQWWNTYDMKGEA